MDSIWKRFYYVVLLLSFKNTVDVHGQACDDINLDISTPNITKTNAYMTYVGDNLTIICNFTCTNCDKDYLLWDKDGKRVYNKFWPAYGGSSGPTPDFTDRVELVSDDQENAHNLKWIEAEWDDTAGAQSTQWTCTAGSTQCPLKAPSSIIVEYYQTPHMDMYAKGDLVKSYEDLPDGEGLATCTVASHPDSQITMLQEEEVLSNDSSCVPISGKASICSLNFTIKDFIKGFQCTVRYNSPVTGAYEEVLPTGCCPEGLYPVNLPSGLSGGAIAGIVIACVCAVTLVGGVVCYVLVYNKNSLPRTDTTDANVAPTEGADEGDQTHRAAEKQDANEGPIGEADEGVQPPM